MSDGPRFFTILLVIAYGMTKIHHFVISYTHKRRSLNPKTPEWLINISL